MLPHGDRTHPRAATAMRDAERLVQVEMGHVPAELARTRETEQRVQVRAVLDGRAPSPDAQAEAYRLLLVAICNDWHRVMPFLFERIDDYTELLLPDDLLSNASILAYVREAMTPGTPQPEAMSIGMKDLPDRPNLRKMRSMIKATRDI